MFRRLLPPINELSCVKPTADDVDDDSVRLDPYGSNNDGFPLVLAALPGGFFKSIPNCNYNLLIIVNLLTYKTHRINQFKLFE